MHTVYTTAAGETTGVPGTLSLPLRGQRAPSLTGARSPRLRRRRGHSLTCPLPHGRGNVAAVTVDAGKAARYSTRMTCWQASAEERDEASCNILRPLVLTSLRPSLQWKTCVVRKLWIA